MIVCGSNLLRGKFLVITGLRSEAATFRANPELSNTLCSIDSIGCLWQQLTSWDVSCNYGTEIGSCRILYRSWTWCSTTTQTFAEIYYYAEVWKLHLCGAHVCTRVNKQERLMSNYRTSWNCVGLGSETMTRHVSPLFTEHSFYQTLVVQLWLKSIYVTCFHVNVKFWVLYYCMSVLDITHLLCLRTTTVLLWVVGLYPSSFITSVLVAVFVYW